MRFIPVLLALAQVPPTHAQQQDDHLASSAVALQAAAITDSLNYDLYCRAAVATWELGLAIDPVLWRPWSVGHKKRLERLNTDMEQLYTQMQWYARHAIALDSMKPQGHALLAAALATEYLGKGDRYPTFLLNRKAKESLQEADKAIAIDPKQDLAHYVLGVLYGNPVQTAGLSPRQWQGEPAAALKTAIQHLTQAVALAPANITYRVNLALTYLVADRGAEPRADFRVQLQKADSLTVTRAVDPEQKEYVKAALARFAGP